MDTHERATILIADDNPKNLQLLHTLLENEGYRVRVSQNGKQVLDSIRLEKPDLVLLDIHMPQMDGYEVCRIMKQEAELKDIPVIFVSALDEIFNKVEAFEAGGVDYIEKPVQAEEVLARVSTHIQISHQKKLLYDTIGELKKAQTALIRNEKLASMGSLIAGIAHEFNNPINYIKSSIDPLQRDIHEILAVGSFCENNCGKNPEVNERLKELKEEYEYDLNRVEVFQLIQNISAGADKIENIIQNLRNFNTKDESEKTPYYVEEGLDTVISLLARRMKEHDIVLKQEYSLSVPINSYHSQIDQLFLNILSNSIEALEKTDARKTLVIRTKREQRNNQDCGVVEFEDNGDGIPEELQKKIFDPFFTTKEIGKGVGLGLSVAFQIMEEHGGEIEVKNNGAGTTIVLIFPLTDK